MLRSLLFPDRFARSPAVLHNVQHPHPYENSDGRALPAKVAVRGPDGARPHVCSIITSLTSGGAEQLVMNLSVGFARMGDRSSIVTLCDAETLGNSREMEAFMKERIEAPSNCRHVSLGLNANRNLVLGALAMRKALTALSPDIVHVHSARALCMLALTGLRLPVVFTHHNSRLSFPRALFLVFNRIVTCYVAINDATAQIYRLNSKLPVRFVRNAAGAEFRTGSARSSAMRPGRIISVGAVSAQKNYDLLIDVAEAMRDLAGADDMPVFSIAGAGQGLTELRARVERLGLREKIQFLGERSDIAELLESSDVFLNTSRFEGLSVAMIEAMRMALPIVATDVAGNRELVTDGHNGFLLAPDDPSRIAGALNALLRNPEMHRAMSVAAQEKSEDYSLSTCIENHMQIYRSLLK